MITPIRGYAEGFYGHLLSWAERCQIVDAMHALGLNTYYYAPKEDVLHRLNWRQSYAQNWLAEFNSFCVYAAKRNVTVVAGVAPGLDFNFAHLPEGQDFKLLVSKCLDLLHNGADAISLLMDDIDADFLHRRGSFDSEGRAHAALANSLSDALSSSSDPTAGRANCLWVTPRIYADELMAEAPDYLPHFMQTLDTCHYVLHCGSDVVAHSIDKDFDRALHPIDGTAEFSSSSSVHRAIAWDNLYANDYCPRRLFVGPWMRRHRLQDVLLNPTGMVFTDCLLLELMATAMKASDDGESNASTEHQAWLHTLQKHGVPDQFSAIAPYFFHPVFNSDAVQDDLVEITVNVAPLMDAIEDCLWRWKTPLSREWYPAIFGLKHDLLTLQGRHSSLRIRKTQNAPLARCLLAAEETFE